MLPIYLRTVVIFARRGVPILAGIIVDIPESILLIPAKNAKVKDVRSPEQQPVRRLLIIRFVP